MEIKLYAYIALAVLVVWGVYRIAKLASFKGERKERDRAKADEREKVNALMDRVDDGHDVNKHFGVCNDQRADSAKTAKT